MGLIADCATDEAWAKYKPEDAKLLKALKGKFQEDYQSWFTEASALIRQLIPDRLNEFVSYYLADPKRKTIDGTTYKIQDWLNGSTSAFNTYKGEKHFNDEAIVKMSVATQCKIMEACKNRFESSLHDIRQLVQADLFDSEIEAARELHKKGFLRAAGAVCGVIVEKHLQQVCANHAVPMKKTHPTISDLNDPLKTAGVYDVPTWRLIQRLGDIRNLCDHGKGRDPTKEEVDELISGTDKITKTVF
jgi:hypothetical protein